MNLWQNVVQWSENWNSAMMDYHWLIGNSKLRERKRKWSFGHFHLWRLIIKRYLLKICTSYLGMIWLIIKIVVMTIKRDFLKLDHTWLEMIWLIFPKSDLDRLLPSRLPLPSRCRYGQLKIGSLNHHKVEVENHQKVCYTEYTFMWSDINEGHNSTQLASQLHIVWWKGK